MSGWPAGPDRHHGRRHQRDLFGLPARRKASTFRALNPAQQPLPDRSHYFHTPEAGGKVKDQHTQVGRACSASSTSRPEARGRSERAFGSAPRQELALAGIASRANRFIADTYLPATIAASRAALRAPRASDDILCAHRSQHVRYERRVDPRHPRQTPLRQGQGPTSIPAHGLHRQRRAHRNEAA